MLYSSVCRLLYSSLYTQLMLYSFDSHRSTSKLGRVSLVLRVLPALSQQNYYWTTLRVPAFFLLIMKSSYIHPSFHHVYCLFSYPE